MSLHATFGPGARPPIWQERLPAAQFPTAHSGSEARHIRVVFAFVRWATELHNFPTPRQIQLEFGVSRATAYRWRSRLADVYGIVPPPVPEGGQAL